MTYHDTSPFADGFLAVELYYSSAWHDIFDDVDQKGVDVSVGASSESSATGASLKATCTLTNADGTYSVRHPESPLYGLAGRSTPLRATVSLGSGWLDFPAMDDYVSAPDAADLSFSGDFYLEWEGFITCAGDLQLISKWDISGQGSYYLRMTSDGYLLLLMSSDGSSYTSSTTSTEIVPVWLGHTAVKVVIDVDNGASGHDVTFYYSLDGTRSGTWVQLGETVTNSGVMSLYDGTSTTRVGYSWLINFDEIPSRVYGWDINGVSVVDASTLTLGASTFSDGTRTWSLGGSCDVTNTHTVAAGGVYAWPVEWGRKGAESVLSKISIGGPLRRIGIGASPVTSPMKRLLSAGLDDDGDSMGIVAYWPMEDGADAARLSSPMSGVASMSVTDTTSDAHACAGYDEWAGSDASIVVGSAVLTGRVPSYTQTARSSTRLAVSVTDSMSDGDMILSVYTVGSLARVDLLWHTGGGVSISGYDEDGTLITAGGTSNLGLSSGRFYVEVLQETSGSDVDVTVKVLAEGGGWATATWTFTCEDTGRVTRIVINPQGDCAIDMAVAHASVSGDYYGSDSTYGAFAGWAGDDAHYRIQRTCLENGLTPVVRGGDDTRLGAQAHDTLTAVLLQAANADGGLLYDGTDGDTVCYRSRRSMCSQPARLTIPYTDNLVIPMTPVDDDAMLANLVQITRTGGGSALSEVTAGATSTQAPPDGAGVYDRSATLGLYSDDQLQLVADWRAHIGSTDAARYPQLGVDLAHPTFLGDDDLTRDVLDVAPGDRVVITDAPDWLPPEDIDVIVVGRRVEIEPLHARVVWACVPARPYAVAYASDGAGRYGGEGTTTNEALNATETHVDTVCSNGVEWTHDDGDYSIMIGGEEMTVTGVTGSLGAQTLTVTRSVNGVVKTHVTGLPVELGSPRFYGL